MHPHGGLLRTQTSFAVDEPIGDDEDDLGVSGSLEGSCLYASYLRRRLRDTRPSSMDEGTTMEKPFPSTLSVSSRRNPLLASRAMSFDDPGYGDMQGEDKTVF